MVYDSTTIDRVNFSRFERKIRDIDLIYSRLERDIINEIESTPGLRFEGFSFDNYPELNRRVKTLTEAAVKAQLIFFNEDLPLFVAAASNAKSDNFIKFIKDKYGDNLGGKLTFGLRNREAINAFENRQLNVSQSVWKYTDQSKKNIEGATRKALEKGSPARELAKSIKAELKEYMPDEPLPKGVYSKPIKNAQRLARTEINTSYREADFNRWNTLNFVLGIEVRLSNNPNHCDLCKTLQGNYPSAFKFIGFHPQCRCIAVPILPAPEDILDFLDNPEKMESKKINDLPKQFKQYVASRLLKAGKMPYIIVQNMNLLRF